MVREVFCMAVALWAVMWAWDARACYGEREECPDLTGATPIVKELGVLELAKECGMDTSGCAYITNLNNCYVFVRDRDDEKLMMHELNHCRGWTHKGHGRAAHGRAWKPMPELKVGYSREYPPCWRKGDASTHPLFFNDVRNLPKSFDDEGKLRIAFIWDHRRRNRDPSTWVAGLQEAIDLVGVDIEVEVACSSAWTDIPNTPTGAYYYVRDRHAQDIGERNRADLVAVMSVGTGDGYCGVASLGRKDRAYIRTSATSCGLDTFVHEIGHNFGIHHAHKEGYEGRKGWCMNPSDSAKNCLQGTVMSYASGSSRVKRFADVDAGWGTEDHTAAAYLRESIPMQAKAWEIRTGFIGPDPEDRVGSVICPVASQQDSGLPNLPVERSPLVPTTPVHSH